MHRETPFSITELRTQLRRGSMEAEVACQLETITQKTTRTGKLYLEWGLRDASDSFTLKVWDNQPGFQDLATWEPGIFLGISGIWELSDFGLEGKNWTWRKLSPDETESLLAGGQEIRERQEWFQTEISTLLESLKDPRLKALTLSVWQDPRLGPHFRRAAAARDFHHARRGGLVEHVGQMMRSAAAICGVYPNLNRDLLLAGVFFHDVGKLWETSPPENGLEIPIELWGEMLGHISIGIELVNRLWHDMMRSPAASQWEELTPKSEDVRRHLLHLIASHHGELEFGSPVLPKTPEAVALHYVDNLDAKMEMMAKGYAVSPEVAPGVFSAPRPLRQRIISPLAAFDAAIPHAEMTANAAPEDQNAEPDPGDFFAED